MFLVNTYNLVNSLFLFLTNLNLSIKFKHLVITVNYNIYKYCFLSENERFAS